jgi:hypothetical protein
MAKAPAKRRGISLSPHTDAQDFPDLFASPRPADSPAAGSGDALSAESRADDPEVGAGQLVEQLAELRRISLELDARWRRQTDQARQQVRILEEQREQIIRQTGRLESLEQMRRRSGRLGFLLMLLSVVSVGALAYHTWPQIQGAADDWKRLSAGAVQLAPELEAMHAHLDGVRSELSEMGGAVSSLKVDVAGVRADLGTLREQLAAAPEAPTNAGHRGIARNATTMTGPYRNRYPGMPW